MERHRLDRTPTASEHICESFVASPSDSQTVEDPQMKNGTRNVMHITCGKCPSIGSKSGGYVGINYSQHSAWPHYFTKPHHQLTPCFSLRSYIGPCDSWRIAEKFQLSSKWKEKCFDLQSMPATCFFALILAHTTLDRNFLNKVYILIW